MSGVKLGNPAPLGLLAFGLTTCMLMYVDAGWVEPKFEQMVAGYALFYGGLCQVLVAIFELLKGSSFSFAVFGSYGAFWLGWGFTVVESHRDGISTFDAGSYRDGKVAWLISFGLLSTCFFAIVIRKNVCLIVTFFLLVLTFFLLAAATATGNATTKECAGYFGFFTAVAAWYTGVAELINEEYGRHVLPGLAPIVHPSRFVITKEAMKTRISYDTRANTLFLSFRSLQIKSPSDIISIHDAVEESILKAGVPDNKVHVIVDYNDAFIAEEIFTEYWDMVQQLQEKYYLSASRFYVTSFGSGLAGTGAVVEGGMKSALDRKDDVSKSHDGPNTYNAMVEAQHTPEKADFEK